MKHVYVVLFFSTLFTVEVLPDCIVDDWLSFFDRVWSVKTDAAEDSSLDNFDL